ncbi:MAG: acyl-CoA dehydrogenase [Burkholderiaceae bacterium]|jgi:alkylation response protein AidB-like acyl-CoA dehydrogenase|nr:acyl-CoA dehydrogenase [Burkholderiaceae bacterium]
MTQLICSRRDLAFLLYEWLGVERLTERARFADHSRETFDAALDIAERIATDLFATHNRKSDLNEPTFDGQRVHLVPEIKQALDAFRDAGLMAAEHDEALGGMQLPVVVAKALFAYFKGSNVATAGYAMLTVGNANLLLAHGTPAQIDAFVRPQLAGRFFGTMCLSEPQAGSSLSDISTRAEYEGESPLGPQYRLTGNKMWISAGEHDLAENIVHLVLAKIPAPDGRTIPGVKGISLFVVPKFMVSVEGDGPASRATAGERNDVVLAGLNHKMGYRGTTNCLLNFGEGRFRPGGARGAIGYLVGEAGRGLAAMFHMMNEARIGVGLGAAMLGYGGYLHSLDYARTRPQGRPIGPAGKDAAQPQIPIIEHADVKRMLLAQKAYAEGALALNLLCASLVDDEHTALAEDERRNATLLLDILTPVAKSWPSQWCVEGNSLAIQVLGGYGYTRDYAVEQFYRDNRLNAIHEGTHGIQALDLLGRKVVMQDGAALTLLGSWMEQTIRQAGQASHEDTRRWAGMLTERVQRVSEVTRRAWSAGDPARTLANATAYLEAFGHVVLAWIWLDQSLAAAKNYREEDSDFYHGKWQACRYFFVHELPKVDAWLDLVAALDTTTMDMRKEWF